MNETKAEFEFNLNSVARIATEDESFGVTVYISPNDGVPLVEIEHGGELRVYVNDGAVFDGHTEARYILKHDAGPDNRLYGIWDNVENTWYATDGLLAYYYAGVPMWRDLKDARTMLGQLNERG